MTVRCRVLWLGLLRLSSLLCPDATLLLCNDDCGSQSPASLLRIGGRVTEEHDDGECLFREEEWMLMEY